MNEGSRRAVAWAPIKGDVMMVARSVKGPGRHALWTIGAVALASCQAADVKPLGKPLDDPRQACQTANLKPFDDLRQMMLERSGRSLSGVDLRGQAEVLQTTTFDTRTKWPTAELIPSGFSPARILEVGADPGLGIRALHAKGIAGRGVNVAIIDQPLLQTHREYAGKIADYSASWVSI
jgi:hypothetical protein